MARYDIIQAETQQTIIKSYDKTKAERIAAAWSSKPENGTLIVARHFESGPRRGTIEPMTSYRNGEEQAR